MPEVGSSSAAKPASLHNAGRAKSAVLLAAAMRLPSARHRPHVPDAAVRSGAGSARQPWSDRWHDAGRFSARRTGCVALCRPPACSRLCRRSSVRQPLQPAHGADRRRYRSCSLLRGLYGAAMGMVFAHAMARCAARRPNTAYGGMFLLQLLLATLGLARASCACPDARPERGAGAALARTRPGLQPRCCWQAYRIPATLELHGAVCNAPVPRAQAGRWPLPTSAPFAPPCWCGVLPVHSRRRRTLRTA